MLKANSTRYHPEFELQQAVQEYRQAVPLRKLHGEMITSPYDIYAVETLRDQLKMRSGQAIPTDLFVYCLGEPPKPDCTKVGGTPYWTGDRKWPVDKKKTPLRFFAQFNFVDSKDLVGPLPGDVLLVFAGNEENWLSAPFHFEWLPSGGPQTYVKDSTTLLFPTTVFHGAIYRTADFPEAKEIAYASNIGQPYNLPILNGTKIAGRPHFIQSDDDLDAQPARRRPNPFRPGEWMTVPARPSRHGYLCQLGSIQAHPDANYPWCNQSEPLNLGSGLRGIHHKRNSLSFDDMGSIYIYRNEKGGLWSETEGY